MELERSDGARIHYEVRGEGEPAILLASYWSWVPGTYEELLDELAVDHRVTTYHLRGNGDSSAAGPFDMETDAGDLEAVVEKVGAPTLLVATADASNRAVKVAARRPDLVTGLICFGIGPFARGQFEGQEAMVTSETVVNAFIEMLESNYRGAMRTFMESTNPQMSSDELRERVAVLADFCSAQAAVDRLGSWLGDDPSEEARGLGNRLWILASSDVASAWMPPAGEIARITHESLPDAGVIKLEPGPVSNPSGAAEAIRRIAASIGEAAQRK